MNLEFELEKNQTAVLEVYLRVARKSGNYDIVEKITAILKSRIDNSNE